MLLRLLLGCLWFACFVSFNWAARKHFRNSGVYTRGMRWTFVLATLFALLQGVAIYLKPASMVAASLFYTASLALFWCTIVTTRDKGLGACYASIESHELVTSGPYRWIRHPFYVSYLLAWIAGAAVYPPLIIAPIVMFSFYWRAALEEESRFRKGPHGRAYDEYCSRTGRFFISFSGTRRRIRAAEASR